MGKRGPAPEPSILKYIRGNPGKEPLNANEPTPDSLPEDFPPPKILEGVAVEIWNDMVFRLSNMRVLTVADVPALTRYCIEGELYLSCYKKVQISGEQYVHWEPDPNDSNGKLRIKYTQVSPWATQMQRHHQAMLQIEREFGMTPSSRSQVVTNGLKAVDPLAAFAAERSRSSGA